MAIFATGSLIGSISGPVGGASFVNSRGSKTVRISKHSSSLSRERTSRIQTFLQIAIHQWQGFDEDTKNSWRTNAKLFPTVNRLGISREPSGYQHYLKKTCWQLSIFGNLSDDLPDTSLPFGFFNIEIFSSVATGIKMTFDDPPSFQGQGYVVYGRELFRKSIMKFNNTWRKCGSSDTLSASSVSLDFLWEQQFPLPTLGQAIAVRIISMDSAAARRLPPVDSIVLTTA